ncbi:hypothetical protein GGR58DRAFT_207530 [Xylaria digitata]|nr:hypothetical protein GGR58DRAFT_207530 [Xylaria digitata]
MRSCGVLALNILRFLYLPSMSRRYKQNNLFTKPLESDIYPSILQTRSNGDTNVSTSPELSTPLNGPLRLGTVVEDLNLLEPINESNEVEIPLAQIYTLKEKGFRTTIENIQDSKFGILANFLGLAGLTGEIAGSRLRSAENAIYARELETVCFHPSTELVSTIVASPSVRTYLEVTRKRSPIYLITGLKIAHGASWSARRGKGYEARLEFIVPDPISNAVAMGPKVDINTVFTSETFVEASDSFILAYRTTKIWLL